MFKIGASRNSSSFLIMIWVLYFRSILLEDSDRDYMATQNDVAYKNAKMVTKTIYTFYKCRTIQFDIVLFNNTLFNIVQHLTVLVVQQYCSTLCVVIKNVSIILG